MNVGAAWPLTEHNRIVCIHDSELVLLGMIEAASGHTPYVTPEINFDPVFSRHSSIDSAHPTRRT